MRGWDLRALLLHMNDSLLTLHEAIAVGHASTWSRPRARTPTTATRPVDPVATCATAPADDRRLGRRARAPTTISIADRPLAAGIVAATGALEVAVHGWDVARACGRDRPVPAALAEELLVLGSLLVSAAIGRHGSPPRCCCRADERQRPPGRPARPPTLTEQTGPAQPQAADQGVPWATTSDELR